MKIIITIISIFLFIINNSFAKEINDFDYKNYMLRGVFKKQIHNPENPNYFWTWEFYIFDNKIYLNFIGDMIEIITPQIFPNGIFELNTNKNSKIKIKTENGKIINFEILSSIEKFKKNENNIIKNYCKQGYFYSIYNDLYFEYSTKSYFIFNENKIIEIIKKDDKLLSTFIYNSNQLPLNSNVKYKFKLIKDNKKYSKNYNKTRNNKYILKEVNNKDSDLIIENCEIIYFEDINNFKNTI